MFMHICAHRCETSSDMELKTAKHAMLGQKLNNASIFFVQMFGMKAGFLGFNLRSAVESGNCQTSYFGCCR